MTVLTVRYQVQQEHVAEVEAGIEKMMAAIERELPTGMRYALGKLPDGGTFVGVLELEDGLENPLLSIPAAREFQQNLGDWVVGDPPTPRPVQILASYRLFD